MGRKGPRAKTKTVLKSVSKMQQLGTMPNFKFQTFLNKNHPTRACDLDESETEGSCLKNVESGKQRQILNSVEEEALKSCCKGSCKLRRSCLEIGESGNEGQDFNSVVEETLKSSCKEVEMCEESSQGTLRSGKERRDSDLVEEEVVECYKKVAKFGSQDVSRLKEMLSREILYRGMLEKSTMQGKVIEKELTFSSGFTRALTDKGGKLAKSIRQGSGAYIHIYIPSVARGREKGRVVVRGHAEMVNKAEQMLEELLSSVVEISVSPEEKDALLSRCGKERGCILDKIRQRISVPLSMQGMKAVIFGKPEETKVAKEIFEEELRLVQKILSTSSR